MNIRTLLYYFILDEISIIDNEISLSNEGKIWVVSESGKGSEFKFSLPVN